MSAGLPRLEEFCVPCDRFLLCVFAFGLFGLTTFAKAGETPIPTPRPPHGDREIVKVERTGKQSRLHPRVTITETPQAIPPSRQNVRSVGLKFLPDASEEIELAGESEARSASQLKPRSNQASGAEVAAKLESEMPKLAEIPAPEGLSIDGQ
jgi:hypothetical protein